MIKTLDETEHKRMLRSVTNYLQLIATYQNGALFDDAKKVKGFLG